MRAADQRQPVADRSQRVHHRRVLASVPVRDGLAERDTGRAHHRLLRGGAFGEGAHAVQHAFDGVVAPPAASASM